MQENGIDHEQATENARKIAEVFGKLSTSKDESTRIQQLCFISPEESKLAHELADKMIRGEEVADKPSSILLESDTAADIAMFGRMLADSAKYNRQAAVQVSHALTTHRAIAEDDYYTALDDFVDAEEETGAGFLGVQEFGSGVFYVYVCIDKDLLHANVNGHAGVRDAALSALVQAAATVAPGGKQASYGTRTLASYIMAERGGFQPRTLATAFLNPVQGTKLLEISVAQLNDYLTKLDKAYGPTSEDRAVMDVEGGHGSLAEVIEFALD
jgi:CRISPR system Cascade subunit CasC